MADGRGTLTVTDRALTRIARQVTLGVPGVAPEEYAGTVERTLGRLYPRVQLQRTGARARVTVEVALTWPASSAQVAGQVQEAVRRELERQAGQDVLQVSVAVREVVRSASARPTARVR
ncbi:Asp23/Gls24 family envelope stress response protein [Cellulomonas sp. ICMP 17802]|uniref:Asp23/Gls24 family envelope stress response protein n=1 Tax=Cellulomonas sp. ICMP 17802 TaxID=3239199 RepID=UPI00351AD70E